MIISVAELATRLDKPRCRDRAKNTDIFSSRKPIAFVRLSYLSLNSREKIKQATERGRETPGVVVVYHRTRAREREREREGRRTCHANEASACAIHRNARDCMPIRLHASEWSGSSFGSDCVLQDLLSRMTPPSGMQSVACDAIYQRAIGADALRVSKDRIVDHGRLDRA